MLKLFGQAFMKGNSESGLRLALLHFWPNNKLDRGHSIMTLLIWLTFIAAAVAV